VFARDLHTFPTRRSSDLTSNTEQWTCPMHPEIVQDEPGSCPICGMDLVPMQADLSSEEKTYKKLSKKFWIATAFTLPIFFIAMRDRKSTRLNSSHVKISY